MQIKLLMNCDIFSMYDAFRI